MSARALSEASGPSAARPADGSAAAPRRDTAGLLLGRLSVLPALLTAAWLLAGLPLLLAGHFTAVLMLVVSVPLAAIILPAGLRWMPARPVARDPAADAAKPDTPWWAVAGVIAVAVAFGVDQMIYHSEFIIVTRDPGTYFQFANWIAHHGFLPIPQDQAAFGGTHHVLQFSSFGFYQVGTGLVPQFMAGLPMVLSTGFWTGGAGMAAAMGPIIGACAVLTFGGLVARLAGPRWAPLAALVLAISLPEEFTSRSTYSEPLAQILLFGGLCLLIDSLTADGAGTRILAALGGLILGLTVLVRIDGLGDLLPLVPYCGLLIIGRRRQAGSFLAGLVVGGGYGVVDGLVLSRPYWQAIPELKPLGLVFVLVLVVTVVAILVRRNRGVPDLARTWLPNTAAALVVVAILVFAVRPYVQKVHSASQAASVGSVIEAFQRGNRVPLDPTRTYAELSLHWVFWYIGVPAVIFGTFGAAVLFRRCLRGQAPAWILPLAIFSWATVTTLYQPSIVPDNPWASRRLVPTVLPGFILLAVWALGWLSTWLRRRNTDRAISAALLACCVAAMILPAAVTTLGPRPGKGAVVAAEGLAFKRTYQGEIAAVDGVCAAIPRHASVLFLDSVNDANWLAEAVRETCAVPVASVTVATPGQVRQVVQGIYGAGRHPVLLAQTRGQLLPYGGPTRQVMALQTTQDAHTLTRPPLNTIPFIVDVWMSQPPR